MNHNKVYHKYRYLINSKKYIKPSLKQLSSLASRGHLKSQKFLYKLFYDGEVVDINYNLSIKWSRYACLQGDAGAQYLLGLMYEEGNGVNKNTKLSIKWKTYSAKKFYMKAVIDLGITYLWGKEGITKNNNKAL